MYVATSIPMLQHCFSAASTSWCHDPSFHVLPWISVATALLSCFFKLVSLPNFSCFDNISVMVFVAALSCIINISVTTQKVCLDRVLSPRSMFPSCSFLFYVATYTFVLEMFCMSRPQYVMSRQHFFCM